MNFHVKPVQTPQDLERFLDVPWRVYRHDPNWVPPLRSDIKKQLSPEYGFRSYGTLQAFILETATGEAVGRVVAAINQRLIAREGQKIGFLGYFECIEDSEAIQILLTAGCEWLRSQGMTIARGPINLYTHNDCLFLVDGFDAPPMLMMPYNPPYYGSAWEANGWQRAKDAYAYDFPMIPLDDRFQRGYQVAQKAGITFRPICLKGDGFEQDLKSLYRLFTDAFEVSWSSSERTEAEFIESAQQLKTLVDPDIFPVAEDNGKMIGFFMALPDFNMALKHVNGRLDVWGILKFLWYRRQINRARTLVICSLPQYRRKMVLPALVYLGMEGGKKRGYTYSELSWVWADNLPSRHTAEAAGATIARTYRVYERSLL